jgi:HTH-type transcriptional regulator/antitoxin MqsA
MKKTDICPICEEGNLTHIVEQDMAEYKAIEALVALHYSECDACGSEQANALDVRNNKRAMQAFRKTVDGLLTGAEIRATRDYLDITQQQAANIFGGGKVAFSKYEADDVNQSDAMDRLIRVAKAIPASFKWLAKNAGEDVVAEKALQNMFAKTEKKTASIQQSYVVLKKANRQVRYPTVIESTVRNSFISSDLSLERLAS